MDYNGRLLLYSYYRNESRYDYNSNIKFIYQILNWDKDMYKYEPLTVDIMMQDVINNIDTYENLNCKLEVRSNSHEVSIHHKIDLKNIIDIASKPDLFKDSLNLEDLISNRSSELDFSDKLAIQFRFMTDKVRWKLDRYNLSIKDEIDYLRECRYSYKMEINMSLHSNNSIKIKEPVDFRDTLRILYND